MVAELLQWKSVGPKLLGSTSLSPKNVSQHTFNGYSMGVGEGREGWYSSLKAKEILQISSGTNHRSQLFCSLIIGMPYLFNGDMLHQSRHHCTRICFPAVNFFYIEGISIWMKLHCFYLTNPQVKQWYVHHNFLCRGSLFATSTTFFFNKQKQLLNRSSSFEYGVTRCILESITIYAN